MEVTEEVTTKVRCCQVNTYEFVGGGGDISADLKNRNATEARRKAGFATEAQSRKGVSPQRHRGTEMERSFTTEGAEGTETGVAEATL
jgi:hypothetical protein